MPARVMIRNLRKDQLPDSGDISFVGGWANPPQTKAEIEPVVKRWRKA